MDRSNSNHFNFPSTGRRGAEGGYPNHCANTSSNTSSSLTRGNNQVAVSGAGAVQMTWNPSSSTSTSAPRDQHEENRKYVIFDELSQSKFVGSNNVLHTGDGHLPMQGFNGLNGVTFGKGFRLTAAGMGSDGPSSKPGAGMEYFSRSTDLNFDGADLRFIGDNFFEGGEQVLVPTTSSSQQSVAPQTQTYGGGGPSATRMISYNLNQSLNVYSDPQDQGNGQRYGQDWSQGPWDAQFEEPMEWRRTGTHSASYGRAHQEKGIRPFRAFSRTFI